jgi:glycerophosphoryl diester phosphodiesterase
MLFNSFDAAVLEYIDRTYPGKFRLHGFYPYERMYHVDRDPAAYLYCACLKENCPETHYTYLLERGIEPWVSPAVLPEDLEVCFRRGARLVTTNDPAACLQKLEKIGAR